jgi:hypothetical protein
MHANRPGQFIIDHFEANGRDGERVSDPPTVSCNALLVSDPTDREQREALMTAFLLIAFRLIVSMIS